MNVQSKYKFKSPAQKVGTTLMDPEQLAHCMPEYKKMDHMDNDHQEDNLSVSKATLKEKYACALTIKDKQPFTSYRLVLEGNRALGFVKGKALVSLTEEEGTTIVTV